MESLHGNDFAFFPLVDAETVADSERARPKQLRCHPAKKAAGVVKTPVRVRLRIVSVRGIGIAAPQSDPSAKRPSVARRDSDPATDTNSQPNSDWSFYNAGKPSSPG